MKLLREQGDTNFDLGSRKIVFGSIKKIIHGAGRKGSNFKGSRELGTPPPYGVSLMASTQKPRGLNELA